MEHHGKSEVTHRTKLAIFHSYVEVPESKLSKPCAVHSGMAQIRPELAVFLSSFVARPSFWLVFPSTLLS